MHQERRSCAHHHSAWAAAVCGVLPLCIGGKPNTMWGGPAAMPTKLQGES